MDMNAHTLTERFFVEKPRNQPGKEKGNKITECPKYSDNSETANLWYKAHKNHMTLKGNNPAPKCYFKYCTPDLTNPMEQNNFSRS
jgi:hypothetical protein